MASGHSKSIVSVVDIDHEYRANDRKGRDIVSWIGSRLRHRSQHEAWIRLRAGPIEV